jgi:NTP pyrophosphatase (non-canonical NTP hydrolase)
MNFGDYQIEAAKTAIYTDRNYPALGLAEESGELLGIIAKAVRDNRGQLTVTDIARLQKEAGDVLWMLAMVCMEYGLNLQEVAELNVFKLRDRQSRGVLGGRGDDR